MFRAIALSLFITILFGMENISMGQECDCPANFQWVKETFEANDAGFALVIEKKGKAAYDELNETIEKRVKEAQNLEECLDAIQDWLLFFRKGHIGVQALDEDEAGENLSKKQIRSKFKDWQRIEQDTKKLEKSLSEREKDGLEGVWVSGDYKVGVIKQGDDHLGVILKADGVYWMPGQVKFQIRSDKAGSYYMLDHSEEKFQNAQLLDANHLVLGEFTFTRKNPKVASDPAVLRYMKAMDANMPYLEEIDPETYYLRIPSFNINYKAPIDKLITQEKEKILSKPKLIIDIRNNGGGSDDSYDELLPILYTQPIEVVGAELLSTPLNNKGIADVIKNPKLDEETREFLEETFEKLSNNIGEFVNLEDEKVQYIEYDEIHPSPSKIAILINENNASAAEEFLLAARQSKKVQLFGNNTAGILDVSNVNIIKSPCKKFVLAYSLSKSYRIPEKAIDNVGVTPDHKIPPSVPGHEWVDFAMKKLVDK